MKEISDKLDLILENQMDMKVKMAIMSEKVADQELDIKTIQEEMAPIKDHVTGVKAFLKIGSTLAGLIVTIATIVGIIRGGI